MYTKTSLPPYYFFPFILPLHNPIQLVVVALRENVQKGDDETGPDAPRIIIVGGDESIISSWLFFFFFSCNDEARVHVSLSFHLKRITMSMI